MKYLIQSLILSSIVVVFTACTPKITVKTLNAPKVIDINTKQMAIVTFNNDNAGQTQAIESQLNSVYFNGIKYYTLINQHNIDTIIHEKKLNNQDGFRLYSGSTEAKSILTGQIDFNTTSYTKYHKEIKDYDYCLRFKGDKKDRQYPKQIHEKSSKQTQCIKYAIQYVPCKKQQYDLQTTLKLINIEDSKILLSKTYVESSTHNKCRDDRRILPHLAQENTHLANAIAKRFVRDITPTYSYHNIDIIEEVELNLDVKQQVLFNQAIENIKNSNLIHAQHSLDILNNQLHQKSAVVLYNLALTHESMGSILNANSLYTYAHHLNQRDSKHQALIIQAMNRTNHQIAIQKQTQELLEH